MAIGAKLKARARVEREKERLLGGQKRGLPSAGQGRMSSYKAPSAKSASSYIAPKSVARTVAENNNRKPASYRTDELKKLDAAPTVTPSVTRAYQEKIRKRKKEMNNMIKTAIDKRDYALPENRVGLRAKGRTISKTKWGR